MHASDRDSGWHARENVVAEVLVEDALASDLTAENDGHVFVLQLCIHAL